MHDKIFDKRTKLKKSSWLESNGDGLSDSMIDALIEKWETEIRRGVIQLLVCAVLAEKDLNGMGIIEVIQQKTSQIVTVPLGTVYPLLRRFQTEKLIEKYKPPEDARQTIYKLNSRGHEYFERMTEMWLRYSGAVNNVLHSN